jgi:hypothetical protein
MPLRAIIDTRKPKGHNPCVLLTITEEIEVMLEKERQYFSEHHAELISRHLGKFVVIQNEEFIGAFNTIEDALAGGARRFGLEPFLVRQVTAAEEKDINIPALTLGILRADSSRPV